jgi:hypothetical protein
MTGCYDCDDIARQPADAFLKQAYCAVFSDSFACMSDFSHQLAAETLVFNDLHLGTDASTLAFFSETKAVVRTHHAAWATEMGASQQLTASATQGNKHRIYPRSGRADKREFLCHGDFRRQ